jgi:hypothetical protein
MTMERLTQAPEQDAWWTTTEAPEPAPTRDGYTPEKGAKAADRLGRALTVMAQGVDLSDTNVPDAAQYLSDNLDVEGLVGTIAMVQDLRRALALTEAYLSRQAGLLAVEMNLEREGHLPDGRPWTLKRGNTRKAWSHDEWKHDARAKITAQVADDVDVEGDLVVATTGEVLTLAQVLQGAIAQAQEVHGSTAPRVGAMKALGLTPADYCEEVPGTWGVSVLQSDNTDN